MSALRDADKPGPVWKDLESQTYFLSEADQAVLYKLTSAYEGDAMHSVGDVELRKQFDRFPAKLYPFISQASTAWLALRKYHAITASVAFDLLLCGTGQSRQRYGSAERALKMSSYRKSAPLTLAVQQGVPHYLETCLEFVLPLHDLPHQFWTGLHLPHHFVLRFLTLNSATFWA
jgi:hypothetical protein